MRIAAVCSFLTLWLVAVAACLAPAAVADQTTIASYDRARALLWRKLYPASPSPLAYSDLYCGYDFGNRDELELQVEHVYPANWMASHLGCGSRTNCRRTSDRFNRMEADLHNLWPAAAAANGARSNHSFGIIAGETWLFEDCDIERAASTLPGLPTRMIVEPRPLVRGNIARALFYMAAEYRLPLEPRLVPLLKEWHLNDPVSREERRRNDLIENLQGTRNLFIDDPSAATAFQPPHSQDP